jgi:hypothetical protein
MVTAVGEDGCGYEASLESWYRFLIDPAPYGSIKIENSVVTRVGTDDTLLQQRAAFLRPDSMVAIVMLTDEDDCSIREADWGWAAAQVTGLQLKSTSACETGGPNDPCCLSCLNLQAIPSGCTPPAEDPNCAAAADDPQNLRCWQQKRRFGADFLWPTERYSSALKNPTLCPKSNFPDWDCNCSMAKALGREDECVPGEAVINPLFAPDPQTGLTRDPSLVFLAGIVGVPWQDITKPGATADHVYLNYDELSQEVQGKSEPLGYDYWQLIVGDPKQDIAPRDPFMIDAVEPRQGSNPVTGDTLSPTNSLTAMANPINGHEWNTANEDLQYACVFELEPDTVSTCVDGDLSCDCESRNLTAQQKPLCQDATGAYGTTQLRAKAYPGRRHLEVLEQLKDTGIVASICPWDVQHPDDTEDYGYNPAVNAIIERLKKGLNDRCLTRRLTADEQGQVPCTIIEAARTPLDCSHAGLQQLGFDYASQGVDSERQQKLERAVREQMLKVKICGPESIGQVPCESLNLCEVAQLRDEQQQLCQTVKKEELPTDLYGYCYVDATVEPPIGEPDLVQDCDASARRMLRFVGQDLMAPDAITFVACAGATFTR